MLSGYDYIVSLRIPIERCPSRIRRKARKRLWQSVMSRAYKGYWYGKTPTKKSLVYLNPGTMPKEFDRFLDDFILTDIHEHLHYFLDAWEINAVGRKVKKQVENEHNFISKVEIAVLQIRNPRDVSWTPW